MNRIRASRRWLNGAIRVTAACLVASLLLPLLGHPAAAAPRTVWLEQAGHTLDGLFLDTWRANPSLLGLPISEELTTEVEIDGETTRELIVQYFENLALVYSPGDPRGEEWTVHAFPLGQEALKADERKLNKGAITERASCGDLGAEDCVSFEETKHTLRWGFKEFWEANGGESMIGLPLSEEVVAGSSTIQYFERMVLVWNKEGGVKPRPIGSQFAKKLKVDTDKVAQPLDVPIYHEDLFIEPVIQGIGSSSPGPGPLQGGYKEIVVSVSQQSLWAYEDGNVVAATLVSTGTGNVPETETPRGYFSILTKFDTETMDGVIAGEEYLVEDVPWVMYFDNNGNALHGTYWHSNFGYRMSHGCVNLPLDVAQFLYDWAPIGTAVSVID